ncbi:unnamed protein product [Strongylus vulgaris]|uniref:Uncharacterized protein n=1 Tax=Strongylus vulgaris TaxID=40348 RepID=A0A3P7ISR9_STRVU|nr:unnamed protein product [Strongylus vulgaris]
MVVKLCFSVAKAFTSRRGHSDQLVYFIPCDYSYRKGDEDAKNFIAELQRSKVGDNFLIVSNTKTSADTAEAYSLEVNNVVGNEQEIPKKIADFGEDWMCNAE